MADSNDETHKFFPADRLFNVLARPNYKSLLKTWNTAVDRVDLQPQGAITAAKTLIEGTCKLILDHFEEPYGKSDDMPVLYYNTALKLGIAVNKQTGKGAKKYFGGVSTIIQSINEMRNLTGDAHFGHENTAEYSTALSEAQLAVNLAGSACMYILSCFETYLVEKERVTPDGNLVLKFDQATVWRLIDHTRNAPKHRTYCGSDAREGLWLVGDVGLYLMSNGIPAIDQSGIIRKKLDEGSSNLCVWADGYDYNHSNFDNVNGLHRLVENGSDFCFFLETDQFIEALQDSEKEIIVVLDISDPERYSYGVFSDKNKSSITQFFKTEVP
ncbi:abortive infection family protein [Litorimonas sp. WD9-15]|uniref:abortive infection family protein n=1 Tax=Litorimonas sp. WD9-15 TaxID=3418716 RepID=UPI003D059636